MLLPACSSVKCKREKKVNALSLYSEVHDNLLAPREKKIEKKMNSVVLKSYF